MIGRPADVVSKQRGDEPEVHYLIGAQRATRAEADADLALWRLLTCREQDGKEMPLRPMTAEELDQVMFSIRTLLEGNVKSARPMGVRTVREAIPLDVDPQPVFPAIRNYRRHRKGRLFIVIEVEDPGK